MGTGNGTGVLGLKSVGSWHGGKRRGLAVPGVPSPRAEGAKAAPGNGRS